MGDALEALRLLLDHWDELFLPGALSHASALTPLTPMPRSNAQRGSNPRSSSPSSAGPGRPEEMTLLALFAERGVKLHPAINPASHARACRKCLRPFVHGDDVLVYVEPGKSARDQLTTHLQCRWWWWESPQSPIRPSKRDV
jgi:hypothetical protein